MVSRVEAHVVSHYRSDRAEQLGIVLNAILGWKNCVARVVVSSNTDTYETSGFLPSLREKFAQAGHELILNVVSGLRNPRLLTWEHKKFIEPWMQDASPGEDFFMYIEDDIRITNENLVYFIRTSRTLKSHGLIPGFLRYEVKEGETRLVDITQPEYWQRERSVQVDGQLYHACINPYWAGFILDRDSAREYVASKSFNLESSEFVNWNVQERAAMGLTFESVRPDLRSRLVVPIRNGAPDPDCLVWHCSNSYSAEDHPVVARLTPDQAFTRETTLGYATRKLRNAARRLGRR